MWLLGETCVLTSGQSNRSDSSAISRKARNVITTYVPMFDLRVQNTSKSVFFS